MGSYPRLQKGCTLSQLVWCFPLIQYKVILQHGLQYTEMGYKTDDTRVPWYTNQALKKIGRWQKMALRIMKQYTRIWLRPQWHLLVHKQNLPTATERTENRYQIQVWQQVWAGVGLIKGILCWNRTGALRFLQSRVRPNSLVGVQRWVVNTEVQTIAQLDNKVSDKKKMVDKDCFWQFIQHCTL